MQPQPVQQHYNKTQKFNLLSNNSHKNKDTEVNTSVMDHI